MQYYKLSLRVQGKITQIPDSQKLFGALIYAYKDDWGDEEATILTDKIFQKELFFALSSLLPQGTLPLPGNWLIEKNQSQKGMLDKAFYKEIKKRTYIPSDQIQLILRQPNMAKMIYPYVTVESKQQVHASLESLLYDLPGLEPTLYSVNETLVNYVLNEKQECTRVVDYDVYIEVEESEAGKAWIKWIQSQCQNRTILPLGPRMSQGLNLYQLCDLQAITLPESKGYYLNLGMFVPHQIDYSHSYCKLFTSQRRPYHVSGGWQDQSKIMTYIDLGSLICTQNKREAGRSLKIEENRILFGNAFLYPVEVN